MSVRDKVVVITGAAQGVGRYVARSFAAEGARLVIADVASMDTVTRELGNLQAEVLPVHTDVTSEDDVRSLFDQVYRRWGRIDVLINNAGIAPHFAVGAPRWPRIRDLPLEFFQKVMTTNLAGTFLCTKHALPYMESLCSGHIVNFGQGSLRKQERAANIGSAVYGTSKLAIRAFTRQVADEEREFEICIISMGPGGTMGGVPRQRSVPGRSRHASVGGLVTEDSPDWARENEAMLQIDAVGNRYVLAADAPMELSGEQVAVRNGELVVVDD
jgi:NAD(P)-dependent dehydrogenase (short-subunit alcohol dehydrogenase family)